MYFQKGNTVFVQVCVYTTYIYTCKIYQCSTSKQQDSPFFVSEVEWNCNLFSNRDVVQSIHTKMKLVRHKEMSQLEGSTKHEVYTKTWGRGIRSYLYLVRRDMSYTSIHAMFIESQYLYKIPSLPPSLVNKNVS